MTDSSRATTPAYPTAVGLLMLILLASSGAMAMASGGRAGNEPEAASAGEHGPEELHEIMIFAGATDDRGEYAFTWGAEYSYSFMEHYTVGVFFDRAGGNVRSTVVGLSFWANVVKGLSVMIGPGIEYLDDAHGGEGEGGSDREFLARLGLGYAFHLGKHYTVLPVIHADFVNQEIVWVGGVNLGLRFGKRSH